MKLAPLLLTASLAANLALAAVLVLRQPDKSAHVTAPPAQFTAAKSTAPADTPTTASAALRDALLAGDAAALEAAGIPAEIARDIALGRAMRRAAERALTAKGRRNSDPRWWRSDNPNAGPAAFEEMQKGRRDLSEALVAAFGYDPFASEGASLAFLPADKRTALQQITRDYDEMIAAFGAKGIQLASDREKLRLLRVERERDIAALLTPEELAAYELRTSPSAGIVRARYGDAIETEEDFRTLVALQKAFDEQFPRDMMSGRLSPETMRARADAERQMQDNMRAALGEEKYAALRRASDSDLRTVESLVSRLSLPANTTNQVAATRDSYAAESQRINSDPSLSFPDRRARIQELAQRAKSEVTQMLGSEAADAYSQRSSWLSFLQNGMAYSTSPNESHGGLMSMGGQSVFPVPPGGMPPTSANRQVMTFSAGAISSGGTTGLAFPVSAPIGMDNVQITSMTVHDAVVTPATPANAGPAIARPAPPDPTAQPPTPPKQ